MIVTEEDFKRCFADRSPFIIEEIYSFTDTLRSYSEYTGVPVIELTKELIQDNKGNVGSNTPVVLDDEKKFLL